jgi:hypothetical protein
LDPLIKSCSLKENPTVNRARAYLERIVTTKDGSLWLWLLRAPATNASRMSSATGAAAAYLRLGCADRRYVSAAPAVEWPGGDLRWDTLAKNIMIMWKDKCPTFGVSR